MSGDDPFDDWHPTFLERLIGAQREVIHSAIIGWVLNTPELPLDGRAAVLRSLGVRLPEPLVSLASTTEWEDIDLIVDTPLPDGRVGVIAIENKLKAVQSKKQLATYDKVLPTRGEVLAKVFLTVVGDEPESGTGWQTATYADLLVGLEQALELAPKSVHLAEYVAVVRRVVAACRLVTEDDRGGVLIMGSLPTTSGFGRYMRHADWQKTLARVWLAAVGRQTVDGCRAGLWRVRTGHAHRTGDPVLDLERIIVRKGQRLRIGLEYQQFVVKAFASPSPYGEPASDLQRAAVGEALEEIRTALNPSPTGPPSTDRGSGFSSFTLELHEKTSSTEEIMRRATSRTAWADGMRSHLVALETLPD